MSSSPLQLKAFIQAATQIINEHAEEVTALDQAIGDGDHVFNLQRGLTALEGLADELAALNDWSTAFQKIGMSLMSSVGGASGSLYGTFFLAMSKALNGKELELPNLAVAFDHAVDAVKLRGKADLGEKTMLDVLIPVANVLRISTEESLTFDQILKNINLAAAAGCETTRDMIATKGRASFLGDRARGHLDPGARTSQLMIEAITNVLAQTAQS